MFKSKHILTKLCAAVFFSNIFYCFSANALSATSVQVINGTEPYISIDNNHTPANITDLLWIAVENDQTNGTEEVNNENSTQIDTRIKNPNLTYYIPDFDSSPDKLIVLPKSVETFENIITLLTDYNAKEVDIFTILNDHQYVKDDDGDNGFNASGTMSLTIKDNNNNTIEPSEKLNNCIGYYAITLATTESQLSTTFGVPNIRTYPSVNKTYYVTSSSKDVPTICWLQPSLEKGNPPEFAYTKEEYEANYIQNTWEQDMPWWDANKGFLPRGSSEESYNKFPTTAANKLYFNVVLAGANWSQISYTKNPTTSPISLKLSGKDNVLRVEFTGPNFSEKLKNNISAANNTVFSLTVGNKTIYSFTITQWYLISENVVFKDQKSAKHYCSCQNPRVALTYRRSLTNAKSWDYFFGENERNNYKRTVGTLLSEWGNTVNEVYPSDSTLSNALSNYAWTDEQDYDMGIAEQLKSKLRNFNPFDEDNGDDDEQGTLYPPPIPDDGDDELFPENECDQDPIDWSFEGTKFYGVDLTNGSIASFDKDTQGLKAICFID